MWSATRRVVLIGMLLSLGATDGWAQPDRSPFCQGDSVEGVDSWGLQAVYCVETPVVVRPLNWAHASARPVFYGAVPAAWVGVAIRGGEGKAAAYRLTLTQGSTAGGVLALKYLVGRPRPYVTRPLTSRSERYGSLESSNAYTSFPSGHASISAALTTSWGLSYPRWYVIGPGVAWTVGVSLSRLHLGLHYPSDAVVGILIGAGVAGLFHHFRDSLTPPRLRPSSETSSAPPPPVGLRIRF